MVQHSQQRIKRILVAREFPGSLSPYTRLSEKYKAKLDFSSFISTHPVSISGFRKFKAKILAHTALIFSNKIAIDYFFQLAEASNIQLPDHIKYFCTTAHLSYYLQKYIVLKKRKVFKVQSGIGEFFALLKKNKKEKFLIPSSATSRKDIMEFLKEYQYNYTRIIIYEVLENDLTGIKIENYDIIVLFSLLDVKAFVKNFPQIHLPHTKIAVFGFATARAVKEAGLSFHIYAPTPQATSMVEALELYLKDN